jgi:hypothetical protein
MTSPVIAATTATEANIRVTFVVTPGARTQSAHAAVANCQLASDQFTPPLRKTAYLQGLHR